MESICLIKDLYKVLYQFEKSFSDANSMTINEAMLLCCMKDGKQRTAGALCEYIGLSNSRVSKVITSVEQKGLIEREINRDDKRQMIFSLTEAGWEKIREMQQKDLHLNCLFSQLQEVLKKE